MELRVNIRFFGGQKNTDEKATFLLRKLGTKEQCFVRRCQTQKSIALHADVYPLLTARVWGIDPRRPCGEQNRDLGVRSAAQFGCSKKLILDFSSRLFSLVSGWIFMMILNLILAFLTR